MSGQLQTLRSQLNVKIDGTLHEEIKILSIRTRKNLNVLVEDALQSYVQQLKQDLEEKRI